MRRLVSSARTHACSPRSLTREPSSAQATCTKLLLDAKADPLSAGGPARCTPAHLMARNGAPDGLETLLDALPADREARAAALNAKDAEGAGRHRASPH
jgi:hypothetical protein